MGIISLITGKCINIYHRYIRQGLFRKMSWIGMIILKENENVRTAT